MVARQQQSHRRREGEAAVATVRGHPLVTHVGGKLAGQVLRIREGMQAEPLVSDTHPSGLEADVLQYGALILQREREVFLHQSGTLLRAGNLVRFQTPQPYMPGIVHDAFELFHRLQKADGRVLVGYLPGQQESPAEGAEIAPSAAALTGRLCQEQVTSVVLVRSFIEM